MNDERNKSKTEIPLMNVSPSTRTCTEQMQRIAEMMKAIANGASADEAEMAIKQIDKCGEAILTDGPRPNRNAASAS